MSGCSIWNQVQIYACFDSGHNKTSSAEFCLGLEKWLDANLGFPGGAGGKESACQWRRSKRYGFHPWVGKILWKEEMATHSSILAWKIPWTEEPGRLQSIGSQRVRHSWVTEHTQTQTWVRRWFLLGHGSTGVNTSRKRKLETKGWAWELALGLSVGRERGNRPQVWPRNSETKRV